MSDLKIENFELTEGSKSGHCCFQSTIVDENGNSVCEFMDKEEAKLVFDSLMSLSEGQIKVSTLREEVDRLQDSIKTLCDAVNCYSNNLTPFSSIVNSAIHARKLLSKDGE